MIQFLKKVSYVYMADTPWAGDQGNKLYLTSGQFTSTIKDSEDVGGIDIQPRGISYDGTDTPWAGLNADKLYLTSEQFTSTIKNSEYIGGIDELITGISWDGTNTPWTGKTAIKLYLTSGQFTSTIKESQAVNVIDTVPEDISWDNVNTPWVGSGDDKLYVTSDQFTSTIKKSQAVGGVDLVPNGISWDGTNTPWCGSIDDKLYLTSGQFTSTLKKSEDINAIDATPVGICTNDIGSRLDYISASNTISLGQSVSPAGSIYNRSKSNTISLGQSETTIRIHNRSFSNTFMLCQGLVGQSIGRNFYSSQLAQNIFFNHQLIVTKIFSLSTLEICKLNLARWIFASASKHFGDIATTNSLHYFIEGTHRKTKNHQKYIEFRLEGPDIEELSKNYYRLNIGINILWSFNQDHEDFHESERLKGILMGAMQDICIYKFGDGPYDNDNFLGTLQLRQVKTNNFGQVRSDVQLMQGTVEGTYTMLHSC